MALLYETHNAHVYIQITSETPNVEEHSTTLRGYIYRYSSNDEIMQYTGTIAIEGELTTSDGTKPVALYGNFPNTSQIGGGNVSITVAYPPASVSQSLSGSLYLYLYHNGYRIQTGTAMSVNWTLKKIPSNVTAPTLSASSVNFNSPVNIVTSDPDGASLKYDITYAFGSATGTIGTNLSAGTKAWTVPNSLMAQIPSATSGVIKINVTAKSESGEELASWQFDLTANVPSSVKPTVSATTISEAATIPSALSGVYVQSKSKLSVSHTAAGANGSTITKYVTTIAGTSYNGASFTSNVIQTSGTVAVTVTVTDSRGRTGTRTTNITVVAYTAPKITAVSTYRCTASNNSTAKVDGGYICVKPTGSVSAVSNKNTKACKVYYKKSSASSYTSATLTMSDYVLDTEYYIFTADINSSYDVYVTLQDAFSTTTFYCPQVSSGGAYIHIPPDRSGMGLGKRREASGNIETAWNIKANGDITADADGRPISLQTAGVKQYNFYSSRPSTLDATHSSDGGMIHFLSTSTATTKPVEGHVLHFNWDNSGEWDAQLLLQNAAEARMYVRGKNGSTKVWGPWYEIVTTNNIERLVMTSSVADITIPTITNVSSNVNYAKVARTGKICELEYSVLFKGTTSSSTTITAGTSIGTIPSGYRPIVSLDEQFSTSYSVTIGTDGTIKLNDNRSIGSTATAGVTLSLKRVFYICA